MSDGPFADVLAAAEHAPPDEQQALLCFLAGREIALDPAERNAALRRAQLLLATGGDPRRPLALNGRAVVALAADLDEPAARAALAAGLAGLTDELAGLPSLRAQLQELRADPETAWRAFALATLADALAEDDDES